MRQLIVRFVIMAMVLGATRYGAGITDPERTKVPINSMTVAQLEAAGDQARAQKDYDQAIKYFEVALNKDRKNAVLYNKLGLSELKSGDMSSARAAFQNAVKRNPKYVDPVNNIGAVDYAQRKFGSATRQFKKALALDETNATFHVNLGATWFAQKKLERAIAEYARALELDPEVLRAHSRAGVTAQINPEERAKYSYMLAKLYAKRGDAEQCLRCLQMAKEQGYRNLVNVYKDEEFTGLRHDMRLAQIVPPPAK